MNENSNLNKVYTLNLQNLLVVIKKNYVQRPREIQGKSQDSGTFAPKTSAVHLGW